MLPGDTPEVVMVSAPYDTCYHSRCDGRANVDLDRTQRAAEAVGSLVSRLNIAAD